MNEELPQPLPQPADELVISSRSHLLEQKASSALLSAAGTMELKNVVTPEFTTGGEAIAQALVDPNCLIKHLVGTPSHSVGRHCGARPILY